MIESANQTDIPGSHPSPIGIISGTGPAGRALAARLVHAGHHVVLGSRDRARAVTAASAVEQNMGAHPPLPPEVSSPGTVRGADNDDAATSPLVFIATNASHTVAAATGHEVDLAGAIVVSMASRMAVGVRGMQSSPPPAGAVALALALALPTSRIVAALHHVPAAVLGDLRFALATDLLVCGDDLEAVDAVRGCLSSTTTGNVLDAGGLHSAIALEAMTAVLLTLNRASGGRYGIDLVDQRHRDTAPTLED